MDLITSLAEVFVRVVPDTENFSPDLKKKLAKVDASKAGDQVGKSFSFGFGSAVKGILTGAGIVALAHGITSQISDVFSEAREAAQIGRITENAIKVTGGAAKVTADQVASLSESISNKTGIDDEAVQSGANLLLTFKNIRNEAGKGNDVFSQATAAAQDLAAAGFGDADTAAKMLGKALNDPLKGMTALGKAGVTFTDQQKEQIKTLVESGDVLGAQKIILGEVQTQVGGAAAAAADPMQKLGVVIGNLKERFGAVLLPAVAAVAEWLGPKLVAGAEKVTSFFSKTLVPGIKALGEAFMDPDVTSDGFIGFMEQVGSTARVAFDYFKAEILPRLQDFGEFITGTVVPALKSMAEFVARNRDFFIPFVAILGGLIAALRIWAAVQTVLNVILAANPIGIVIIAIAALAAGIIYLYRHSETFRDIVQGAWQVIQKAVDIAWNYYYKPIFNALKLAFETVWNTAKDAAGFIQGAWETIRSAAQTAWDWLNRNVFAPWGLAWNTLYTAAVNAWDAINRWVIEPFKTGLEEVWDFLSPIVDGFKWIYDKGKSLWNFLSNPFSGGKGGAGGLASAIPTEGGRAFPLPGGKSAYRVTQGLHPVNAIDYGAPSGTPIFASFPGMLQTADLGNRSYGKYFRLTGAGRPILGAHLSAFARRSGFVSQGTLIGWTGNTGNSTGPHLHLENFDVGGILRSGFGAFNASGRPERILNPAQTQSFDTLVSHLGNGRGVGAPVNVYVSGSVVSERDLVSAVMVGMNRRGRRGDPLPA